MDTGTQAIYDEMLRIAQGRGITYYSDIAPMVGLDMSLEVDRNRMARILGDISTIEHQDGRPLLSAIVVRRGEETPGEGFFRLARELGVYRGGDDVQYWTQELQRVYYWHGTS